MLTDKIVGRLNKLTGLNWLSECSQPMMVFSAFLELNIELGPSSCRIWIKVTVDRDEIEKRSDIEVLQLVLKRMGRN